jgi:thiol-disulfide isomerase/thioredoxin
MISKYPNMKNLIQFGLILALMFSCKTEREPTNEFTVSGEIKGLESNLYFRHPDREYSREYPADSILVTDGKFIYTDSIKALSMIRAYSKFSPDNKLYKIAKGGGYYPVKSMYLMFFANPGATIEVSGEATDFMNAYPSGDEINNSLTAINKVAFPQFNNSGNLMVAASHEPDSIKQKELYNRADSISNTGIEERIKHLNENPGSMGALWYLDDMILRRQVDDEKAIDLFENVSNELAESPIYKNIKTRIEGIMATKEGMPVPQIKTTATPDGTEFDITSLQGKYVLIDFWGVWCGPCVAEMPMIKAFQEKHKDKLVVLGINSGDTQEKMEKFLQENDYTWQQLMNDRKNTSDNFVSRFNVQGFPTKFIIDPEGIIVKRFLGSGEGAFELLEELLSE